MGVFLPSVSSIFDPKVNDNNVVWDSRVALDLLDLSIPFSIFSPKQKMILSQGGFATQRSRVSKYPNGQFVCRKTPSFSVETFLKQKPLNFH